MKKYIICLIFLAMTTSYKTFGGNAPSLKLREDKITYSLDGKTFNGVVVYDENQKGKRPAVLIVHEWWGLTEYPVMRARKLAELGYIAMAVDMFGNGKVAANPGEAKELATPFYMNPQLGKTNLDAALAKLKEYSQTDVKKVFAIGYCFGGSQVLNAAKLGAEYIGVVSFHGGLAGVKADKSLLKSAILVCHGGSDKFIPDIDISGFKHQLDSIGANYQFVVYPNATHAFTNPLSTENGKKFNMPIEYNEKADKDSWNDMKVFFSRTLKK